MVNLLKNLRPFRNYIFKIQGEIHFFTFPNTDRKGPKKIQNSNYIALYQKTALRTDIGLREVPELENMRFHFHAFSGWGTSRGQKSVFKAVF